jgi:hypothetical protein
MNIVSLSIEVISGAVGGNVAGASMKENSLGTMGNSTRVQSAGTRTRLSADKARNYSYYRSQHA